MCRFLLVLSLLLSFASAEAQFTRYSKGTRNSMTLIGMPLALSGQLTQGRVTPLTMEEIAKLREREFNRFDRWSIHPINYKADKISDFFVLTSLALPATAIPAMNTDQAVNGMHLYLQAAMANYFLMTFTKGLAHRPRPYVFEGSTPRDILTDREATISFYSGHTSTASTFSFLAASLIQQYSGSQTIRTLGWATAIAVPAVVGYLRIRAGKHWYTDVLVGYASGAMIGMGIPLLHSNDRKLR